MRRSTRRNNRSTTHQFSTEVPGSQVRIIPLPFTSITPLLQNEIYLLTAHASFPIPDLIIAGKKNEVTLKIDDAPFDDAVELILTELSEQGKLITLHYSF